MLNVIKEGCILSTKRIPLIDLYIGSTDGEQESTNDNFERLFYTKNSKYNEIMQPEKFIISGRKGTGKTILANYILKKTNEKKNYYCHIYKKNDFKLQKLLDLNHRDFDVDERIIFWEWFFLLQMGRMLVKRKTIKSIIPFSAEKKLKNFFKLQYPDNIFKLVDFNKSTSTGQKNSSFLGPKQAQFSEEQTNIVNTGQNYKHAEYFELLSRLHKLVSSCLIKKNNIVLIFDDLDEIDERVTETINYYALLKCMLESAKKLNLEFSSIKNGSAKIILLLRSDIIEGIHKYSSNSNKLTTEGDVRLYWIEKNHKNPEDHPLMELILYKIQNSIPEYSSLDRKTLYRTIFPKQLNNKPILDFLLNNSFGRPRDIVQYLNLIRKNNPKALYFEPNFFKTSANEYSKWFYQELQNELSILKNKESILDGLRLVTDMRNPILYYMQIEEFLAKHKEDYPKIVNLKQTIAQLYKYGVIGNSWVYKSRKNKPTIYHYSWGYRDDAYSEPNFSESFVLHHGLSKYFS